MLFGGSFFLNQRKKPRWKNEFCNFFIQNSNANLLQITNCSKYAALSKKNNKKIKNRNPYSKLDGPLKITNHVTLLQNNTTTKYLKTTKKKIFFSCWKNERMSGREKTKTNIDEKRWANLYFADGKEPCDENVTACTVNDVLLWCE